MIENKKTYYHLILDRSGSMDAVREQTLSGVNEQIQHIRELQLRYPAQQFIVNFTWFNDRIENRLVFQDASSLKQLGREDYVPAGMTALYDAVGQSITMLHNSVGREIEKNEASAVVVVITDGYENSSTVYSHKKLKGMIAELERHPNWTFSYLGATLDAVEVAESLSFNAMNSRSFDRGNIKQRIADLSADMEDYASEKNRGVVHKVIIKDRDGGK